MTLRRLIAMSLAISCAISCIAALAASAPALGAVDVFKNAGVDHVADARLPLDLTIVDSRIGRTTLATLAAGRPLVLAPVVHDCPNICGVTLEGVAQAIRAQKLRPGIDFELVAFGIDPNETADRAAASLARLRRAFPTIFEGAGVHAVVAGEAQTKEAMRTLGYRYAFDEEIRQYAHLAAVAVLTREGRVSRWLLGLAPDPRDLELALLEAGEGRIGDWSDRLRLLCYHYDPVTGRYGLVIWRSLQVGGVLAALGLFGFVGLSLRREWRRGA